MKIFENPAALLGRNFWIGAWLVGAVIFLMYYVRIEYMPDFDVSSLSFLLLVAALVGTLFVVSISMFVLLPALIWQWTILGRKEYQAFCLDGKTANPSAGGLGCPSFQRWGQGLPHSICIFFLQLPSFYAEAILVVGL